MFFVDRPDGERVVTKGEVDAPLAYAIDNPPVRFGAAVHRDELEEVQRSTRTERSLARLA